MEKIELEVIQVNNSEIVLHSYKVVLKEVHGTRIFGITIGVAEAHSISIAIEKLVPKRPFTHDLMMSLLDTFGIVLEEVLIYKFEEGIFYSKLVCKFGDEYFEIDSRTSDALAIALRVGCPIYAGRHVVDAVAGIDKGGISEGGFVAKEEEKSEIREKNDQNHSLAAKSLEELKEMLNEVLEQEDYVQAIKIRDEIMKREEKG